MDLKLCLVPKFLLKLIVSNINPNLLCDTSRNSKDEGNYKYIPKNILIITNFIKTEVKYL